MMLSMDRWRMDRIEATQQEQAIRQQMLMDLLNTRCMEK